MILAEGVSLSILGNARLYIRLWA